MYILGDIIKEIETIYPKYLAEAWDNVGLLIGSHTQKVNKMLIALDINEEVVEEAITHKVDCIFTHHPFIFKPLKNLNFDDPINKLIKTLIINNISVYTAHTNLDIADGGINDILCSLLDINQVGLLEITSSKKYCKLIVYVPDEFYSQVRNAMISSNPCLIGNYKGCTFTSKGEGTFIPLDNSNPYLGKVGSLEVAKERKVECVIDKDDLSDIMQQVRKVHPYEEIAFDLIEIENIKKQSGIGRYGTIEKIVVGQYIEKIKKKLSLPYVKLIGDPNKEIEKVSVCSGSGSSYIRQAARVSDLYITGDIKYHDAQEALSLGLTVIDVGHYFSENIALPYVVKHIKTRLSDLDIICSKVDGNVFKIR